MSTALIGAVTLLMTVVLGEVILRHNYRDTPWLPSPEILRVQNLLQPHSTLGYLWKGNIDYADKVEIHWSDQAVEPLSTDAAGFRNWPEAISRRQRGEPIDIVGLGDSFIHDGAYHFYKWFQNRGLFYYNLAMHRHAPPQYTRILQTEAVPLRPRRALYGITELDFMETVDFENWEKSGRDWFSCHSGWWGGSARSCPPGEEFLRSWVPGWCAFYVHSTAARRERLAQQSPQARRLPETVLAYVAAAHRECKSKGIQFLVLLIPSKDMVVQNIPNRDFAALKDLLRRDGIPFLDLTPALQHGSSRPASLYYAKDYHWNMAGMKIAFETVWRVLVLGIRGHSQLNNYIVTHEKRVFAKLGSSIECPPKNRVQRR